MSTETQTGERAKRYLFLLVRRLTDSQFDRLKAQLEAVLDTARADYVLMDEPWGDEPVPPTEDKEG